MGRAAELRALMTSEDAPRQEGAVASLACGAALAAITAKG